MRSHDFDGTAFVWGLVFLIVAGLVVLRETMDVSLDLRWLVPGALIVFGAAGIAKAIRNGRRSLP